MKPLAMANRRPCVSARKNRAIGVGHRRGPKVTERPQGRLTVVDEVPGIVYDTSVQVYQIVVDTSIWIAALRSRRGASHRLLSLLDTGPFEINVSVPLVLEYEGVARRLIGKIPLTEDEINDILDYICRVANHQRVFYLWRPLLSDPDDDMVLELAVTAQCDFIVTHNRRHFHGAERFGITVATPKEFLQQIGALG
jgi:putative PIN family toxin of toxin-antitoxin system